MLEFFSEFWVCAVLIFSFPYFGKVKISLDKKMVYKYTMQFLLKK